MLKTFLENIKVRLGLDVTKQINVQRGVTKIRKNECVYDSERGKKVCHEPDINYPK